MTERKRLPNENIYVLAQLPDEALAAISGIARLWFDTCPALSTALGVQIHNEAGRRLWNRDNATEAPLEPDALNLHLEDWSDNDVGEGLAVTTVSTYTTADAVFGDLMDSLSCVLAEAACNRLRESSDARNAIPFAERMAQRSQTYVDPEAD